MKTIKKIVPFFILACFLGGMVVSCEDDCGCEPKVSHVITSSLTSPADSIIVASSAGNTIIIVGENLASVTGISFVNTDLNLNFPASLNPAFVTDKAIIMQVPAEVDQTTTEMVLTTAQGRIVNFPFAVNIPAPRIDMFYSEFVEAGDELRIKGAYFFEPKIFFVTEDGKEEIEAPNYTLVGSTIAKVTVPEKLSHESYQNMTIKMVTQAGTSFSAIKFRDRSNIILDFDNEGKLGQMNTLLTLGGDAGFGWNMNIAPGQGASEMFDLPENGCDGWYTAINQASYSPEGGTITTIQLGAGGAFMERDMLGMYNTKRISDLVLKFEVYVPKEHPIDGRGAVIYLPTKSANSSMVASDFGRSLTNEPASAHGSPGAFWSPYLMKIDKTTNPDNWAVVPGTDQEFYTDGWMTVTVPLSSFIWNVSMRGYATDVKNYGLTDPMAKAPVPVLNPQNMFNFTFMWNPQDGEQSGTFVAFFDNFRIVPEDGGGAIFGKLGARSGREPWLPGISFRHFDNQ